ncbi:MAG: pyrroloquinoline quinone-dependent dehydrogenase [Salinigranum sp.]
MTVAGIVSEDPDEVRRVASETTLTEVDGDTTVRYALDEPVTYRGDVQQIPQEPVTQQMLRQSADDPNSWLLYGGGYGQQRFTTADVVTPENVSDLSLEYTLDVFTPSANPDGANVQDLKGSSMEGTPLVVPTDPPIMYQTNGPDVVRAVNARTGEILWSYVYQRPGGEQAPAICCGDNNRGVGVLGDTLYMTTLEANLLALDRYTGEQKWLYNSAKTSDGYSATWAPVPYDGKILNGSAGGEYGIRGFVEAVDAKSGERQWRTWTTPKDQWIGDAWKHGASPNWMSVSVDPDTGTLYAAIGNPGPDVNGLVRPGPNVYSSSVVALDANSGDVKWYFQESPHDWWDYDAASPPVLFEREVLGETRTVLTQAGKTGWLYLLDAENGDLYERSQEFCQHLNTFSLPQRNLDQTPWIMPSADGGSEWNPTSFSRETGLIYVKAMNYPSKFEWSPDPKWNPPVTYLGGRFTVLPQMQNVKPPKEWNEQKGVFSAVDPVSGNVEWTDTYEPYSIGGSLSTTTGLTFTGNGGGEFIAYDSATGDRLWEHTFEASVNSSPMSWFDPTTGKQYVAVQAGGGGLRSVTRGDTVAVFSMSG